MMLSCSHCKALLKDGAKFCTNCGTPVTKSNVKERSESLNLIIVFYAVFLVFAIVSYLLYTEYPYDLNIEIAIEGVFALLVIAFSLFDFKSILRLYKVPKVDWKIILFTIGFPIFTAFSVSASVGYVNDFLFGPQDYNTFGDYAYLDNPLIWAIVFVAIMPPIFEELAFRGFLFNRLQNIVSEKITILATAFIFALIHFSFISLIWIFPFGLILGYVRSKYNTLWYGMIIHFIHNFIVLMIDYYAYKALLF